MWRLWQAVFVFALSVCWREFDVSVRTTRVSLKEERIRKQTQRRYLSSVTSLTYSFNHNNTPQHFWVCCGTCGDSDRLCLCLLSLSAGESLMCQSGRHESLWKRNESENSRGDTWAVWRHWPIALIIIILRSTSECAVEHVETLTGCLCLLSLSAGESLMCQSGRHESHWKRNESENSRGDTWAVWRHWPIALIIIILRSTSECAVAVLWYSTEWLPWYYYGSLGYYYNITMLQKCSLIFFFY